MKNKSQVAVSDKSDSFVVKSRAFGSQIKSGQDKFLVLTKKLKKRFSVLSIGQRIGVVVLMLVTAGLGTTLALIKVSQDVRQQASENVYCVGVNQCLAARHTEGCCPGLVEVEDNSCRSAGTGLQLVSNTRCVEPAPRCGDGKCDADEEGQCPSDCGGTGSNVRCDAVTIANAGYSNAREYCQNQPQLGSEYICKQTPYGSWCIKEIAQSCGDDVCDINETVTSCPNDCRETPSCRYDGSSGGTCGEGYVCFTGRCYKLNRTDGDINNSVGVPTCGDGICEVNENTYGIDPYAQDKNPFYCEEDCGRGGYSKDDQVEGLCWVPGNSGSKFDCKQYTERNIEDCEKTDQICRLTTNFTQAYCQSVGGYNDLALCMSEGFSNVDVRCENDAECLSKFGSGYECDATPNGSFCGLKTSTCATYNSRYNNCVVRHDLTLSECSQKHDYFGSDAEDRCHQLVADQTVEVRDEDILTCEPNTCLESGIQCGSNGLPMPNKFCSRGAYCDDEDHHIFQIRSGECTPFGEKCLDGMLLEGKGCTRTCGNGWCDEGEDVISCSEDCCAGGTCLESGMWCGMDNRPSLTACNTGKKCSDPIHFIDEIEEKDCSPFGSICLDGDLWAGNGCSVTCENGVCDKYENVNNCPNDCCLGGTCQDNGYWCAEDGNITGTTCNTNENCSDQEHGCIDTCGNDWCDEYENVDNCPNDCCVGATCQDNGLWCGEDNQPTSLPCNTNKICSDPEHQINEINEKDCTPFGSICLNGDLWAGNGCEVTCGNGSCDRYESDVNCSDDCQPGEVGEPASIEACERNSFSCTNGTLTMCKSDGIGKISVRCSSEQCANENGESAEEGTSCYFPPEQKNIFDSFIGFVKSIFTPNNNSADTEETTSSGNDNEQRQCTFFESILSFLPFFNGCAPRPLEEYIDESGSETQTQSDPGTIMEAVNSGICDRFTDEDSLLNGTIFYFRGDEPGLRCKTAQCDESGSCINVSNGVPDEDCYAYIDAKAACESGGSFCRPGFEVNCRSYESRLDIEEQYDVNDYDLHGSVCANVTVNGVGFDNTTLQPYAHNFNKCMHPKDDDGQLIVNTGEIVECNFLGNYFSVSNDYCSALREVESDVVTRYGGLVAHPNPDPNDPLTQGLGIYFPSGWQQIVVQRDCIGGDSEYSLHYTNAGCNAIDINAFDALENSANSGNLSGNRVPVVNIPPELVAIMEEHQIMWGGRYDGAEGKKHGCDPMEFAYAPNCFCDPETDRSTVGCFDNWEQ